MHPSHSSIRAPLLPPVTICVLCYGDHPVLARRILENLRRYTPPHDYKLRLGLNGVCEETREFVRQIAAFLPVELIIESPTNLYKVGMMRRLFCDAPLSTGWVIWFDDDSFPYRGDWLKMLALSSALEPEVDMWGKRLFIHAGDGHVQFIREAPWYRNLEPIQQHGCYRLDFIAGGYWAIRTSLLRLLDWPDRRLIHFGDDYFLGEALRQSGAVLGQATSGVIINNAPRRAPSDAPRTAVLN
jgi:GT2 family glycosyltransferase